MWRSLEGGAPVWSVAVHWVCRFWGFMGGVGQGQPQPVFCLGPPSINCKLIFRWLLLLVLSLEVPRQG